MLQLELAQLPRASLAVDLFAVQMRWFVFAVARVIARVSKLCCSRPRHAPLTRMWSYTSKSSVPNL